jgi:hypothetical protein
VPHQQGDHDQRDTFLETVAERSQGQIDADTIQATHATWLAM